MPCAAVIKMKKTWFVDHCLVDMVGQAICIYIDRQTHIHHFKGLWYVSASLVAQTVKNLPAIQEPRV